MKFCKKAWLLTLLTLLTSALVVLADFVICTKCGYENEEGARTCVHCKARLPSSGAQAGNTPDKGTPGGAVAGHIDQEIVEGEISLGKEYLKKGDFGVARLFFKNAAGLNLITDVELDDGRSEHILKLMQRCERLGTGTRVLCLECEGTGKAMMTVTSLSGKVTRRPVANKACPVCGGRGKKLQAATISERKFVMGRAASRYDQKQQSRNFVALGEAWVPRELRDKLSVRQQVIVKAACAAPCGRCLGMGRVDCNKCDATGKTRCTNRKCVNGKVEVVRSSSLSRTKTRRTEKCKVCSGSGSLACVSCKGAKSILCSKCNGSGNRPACTRCGGEGIAACKRCKGTGASKGTACTACGGEGAVECSSCNGDGRRR